MSRVKNEVFCTEKTMLEALHTCRGQTGLSASDASGRFGSKVHGRDTLTVIRDVVHLPGFSPFCQMMFCTLARFQGSESDPATNELPDAMPHEIFRQIIDEVAVPDDLVERAYRSTEKRDVAMRANSQYGAHYVLYNSSDAPALYVIALAEYCQQYGKSVLSKQFRHYGTGAMRTVGEAAWRCVQFLLSGIAVGETAGHGLYMVPNTNPCQTSPSGVMRDGFDAYYHADGRPVDYSAVAYVENQALVYEALRLAADVLFVDDLDAPVWHQVAEQVRQRTVEKLWISDENFFAAAYDSSGPVAIRSSAMFELLKGPFLKGLPDAPNIVHKLVELLYSQEFMTPVGPRMLSRKHSHLEGNYWAYQGVRASWPYVTSKIATGLFRDWGLPLLAHDLGVRRMIGGLNRVGHATELWYVDDVSGRPLINPKETTDCNPGQMRVAFPSELGQRTQTWTVSAALHQLTAPRPAEVSQASWQAALDQKIGRTLRSFPTIDNVPHTHWGVNLEEGQKLKDERARDLGYAA